MKRKEKHVQTLQRYPQEEIQISRKMLGYLGKFLRVLLTSAIKVLFKEPT